MKAPVVTERSAGLRIVLLASLGVFFAADDQTSVVALLPSMIPDLGIAQDEFYRAAWIINGYILGFVVIMPLIARAADAIGLGRGYALALILFCIGSAWVALSNDLTTLTVARAVQAIGAGAVLPVSMAMVTLVLPAHQKPLGLGAIAAASEAGGLVGPLWGSVIASLGGWRWVFWINLPMCLPLAASLWMMTPSIANSSWRRLDYLGGLFFGLSLLCLAIALTDDPISGRSLLTNASLLAGAAIFALLFVQQQRRAVWPILRLAYLRYAPLTGALAASTLLGGALAVALVNVPLFTNTVLGGDALEGGLNLMRLSVGLAMGALLGGLLVRRYRSDAVAAGGAFLAAIGFAGMSRWGADPGLIRLSLPLLISGLGFGFVTVPLASTVLDFVPEGERALWSSLLHVGRLLGALVAVALLTSQGLGSFYTEAGRVPLDDPRYVDVITNLQVHTYRDTFLYAAAVCLVALVPIALLNRTGNPPQTGTLSGPDEA